VWVLSPNVDTVRLFLHVLAASVWVGGQIVMIGLVPQIHRNFPDATKLVAQGFSRIAWPAYAIAVVTGIWNVIEVDASGWAAYQITLGVKLVLVAATGIAAAAHQLGQSKVALAVGGAVGFLCAVGAMFVGFLLTTGT